MKEFCHRKLICRNFRVQKLLHLNSERTSAPGEFRMAAFRKGDAAAFNHVFKLYYRQLCYFAHSIIDNHSEAEDLVTESMIKLWRLHTDFETLEKIKAFLYITLRNACLDYLKLNNRKLPHQQGYAYYENTVKLLEENTNYVSARIARAEVLQEIHREINSLPRKCRAIFTMSFLDGMKNEDIASALNLSYHTVKAQKVRALKMLRIALVKKEYLLSIKIFLLFF